MKWDLKQDEFIKICNAVSNFKGNITMDNLKPEIYRQRLAIELNVENCPGSTQLYHYLVDLSDVLDMKIIFGPHTHFSDENSGWAAYCHWTLSGCHMYTWQKHNFMSIDIYTCSPFSNEKAVEFTKQFFSATQIEWEEILLPHQNK